MKINNAKFIFKSVFLVVIGLAVSSAYGFTGEREYTCPAGNPNAQFSCDVSSSGEWQCQGSLNERPSTSGEQIALFADGEESEGSPGYGFVSMTVSTDQIICMYKSGPNETDLETLGALPTDGPTASSCTLYSRFGGKAGDTCTGTVNTDCYIHCMP